MNRSGLILLLSFLLAATPSRSGPVTEEQDTFISRAVFVDGKLWLLSDHGSLFLIAEGSSSRDRIQLPEAALDLWLWDGQPAIATCVFEKCTNFTVRRWMAGTWQTAAVVPARKDEWLLWATSDAGETTLLTTQRMIGLSGNAQSTTVLSERILHRVTSVLVEHEYTYVGLNEGEWGGGLRRIDRKSGKILNIESNTSGQLCGGPLNTECDPVNGIAEEPGKPNCAVAAIGLVHFSPHGRIIEICGGLFTDSSSNPSTMALVQIQIPRDVTNLSLPSRSSTWREKTIQYGLPELMVFTVLAQATYRSKSSYRNSKM